jgi:hypothetical protein
MIDLRIVEKAGIRKRCQHSRLSFHAPAVELSRHKGYVGAGARWLIADSDEVT